MQRLLPRATLIILLILAAMMACSDPTPAPEDVPTPTQVSSTDAPVSTETPTERPTAAPKATLAPEPTSAAPTATPATATQPSRQSQPRESDHIFWVAADLPAILNSQAIKELRSIIKENTVYDLYFVAVSEQAARFYPGAVQVVGQYIEHDTPRGSEDTENLVHRGHWIAYYGELDEQTVLFDPRNPSETARETRGGYIIHTLKRRNKEGYSLAARGYGTFERGATETPKGALGTAHDGFSSDPAEAARVFRELGNQHMLVEARTSPEGQELESDFDLKELSAWDEIPPWTAVIQHALRSAPAAALTLTLEGDMMHIQLQQNFDSETDATRLRKVNQETLAEVVSTASIALSPEVQKVMNRLQVSQHGPEVSYNITLTAEEAGVAMFWGLLWYLDH